MEHVEQNIKVVTIAVTRRLLAEQQYLLMDGDNKILAPRKTLILALMDKIGMTKDGAATYIANLRRGKWQIDLAKHNAIAKVSKNTKLYLLTMSDAKLALLVQDMFGYLMPNATKHAMANALIENFDEAELLAH